MRNSRFLNAISFLLIGQMAFATNFGGAESFLNLDTSVTLIGHVSGKYLEQDAGTYVLAAIEIKKGVISSIKEISESDVSKQPSPKIVLKRGKDYDVVYPGLFNLHNHTKQNNLSVWADAKGQFGNRFEWRDWGNYKLAVSGNMNPWIGYGDEINCAAFRWSELLAMSLGTIYNQGPSSCVENFTIHRVEDASAYRSKLSGVQAPTDIVLPKEMGFVWNYVRPKMLTKTGTKDYIDALAKGATYEEALKEVVLEYCPAFKGKIENVNGRAELKILGDQNQLKKNCGVEAGAAKNPPKDFYRYVYFVHPTIAGKKNYLQSPTKSAVIAHLAEGRRNDPYNAIEFDVLRILGLDQPGMNLVHAVGLNADDFKHMAKNQMGLIWSPFSNFLLYGETADVLAAKKAGVVIALGSDWTPTGSKSVLEELKIARNYVQKMILNSSASESAEWKKYFTDEALVEMVTSNSAKMLGHLETDPNDKDSGAGTLKADAMGSVIVVAKNHKNPATNLVLADAKDINLVVVEGRPLYGENAYIDQVDASIEREEMPFDLSGIEDLDPMEVPEPPAKGSSADDLKNHMVELGKIVSRLNWKPKNTCGFKKSLVHQETELGSGEYFRETGLNLDRAVDIQKMIAIHLLTQSRNLRQKSEGGKVDFAVTKMASLFSCADPEYLERFNGFVSADSDQDEFTRNKLSRPINRKGLGKTPAGLAKVYGLDYDPGIDY